MDDEATRERTIFFFHGKESGPHGTKYRALSELFAVEAPDFQGMDIWQRLEKAEEVTRGMEELVVVGSSYGGLLTALLYSQHPERFKGYLLLAPAFHLEAAAKVERAPQEGCGVVIHGRSDEVVPIGASRAMGVRLGLELVEVEDDHRLHGSLDLIREKARELFER